MDTRLCYPGNCSKAKGHWLAAAAGGSAAATTMACMLGKSGLVSPPGPDIPTQPRQHLHIPETHLRAPQVSSPAATDGNNRDSPAPCSLPSARAIDAAADRECQRWRGGGLTGGRLFRRPAKRGTRLPSALVQPRMSGRERGTATDVPLARSPRPPRPRQLALVLHCRTTAVERSAQQQTMISLWVQVKARPERSDEGGCAPAAGALHRPPLPAVIGHKALLMTND